MTAAMNSAGSTTRALPFSGTKATVKAFDRKGKLLSQGMINTTDGRLDLPVDGTFRYVIEQK